MFVLDHIAVTCADLDTGANWLSEALGVPLFAGGKHAQFGTHNKLLGLADGLYLEVISPDPMVTISRPRWFNLDHAPATPRWGNWICRAEDLKEHAQLTGSAIQMSRSDLNWEITVPDDGSLPLEGGFPTLIKWSDMNAHPALRLPQSGYRLTRWEVHHPQADHLSELCKFNDPRIHFIQSETAHFVAELKTPRGTVRI